MEAKIRQEGEVYVVYLTGALEYQQLEVLDETCKKHLKNEKVVFNLRDLSFVGSVGIKQFFETLYGLYQTNKRSLKLCGVRTEYRKMMEVSPIRTIEIYENEHWAKLAFSGYPVYPSNYHIIQRYLAYDMPDFI